MMPLDIQVPLVLRDVVRAALRPDQAVTVQQLAARIHTGGSAIRQTQRALVQLEQRGQARRERGPQQYGTGRVPDRWTAAT